MKETHCCSEFLLSLNLTGWRHITVRCSTPHYLDLIENKYKIYINVWYSVLMKKYVFYNEYLIRLQTEYKEWSPTASETKQSKWITVMQECDINSVQLYKWIQFLSHFSCYHTENECNMSNISFLFWQMTRLKQKTILTCWYLINKYF